MQKIKTDLTQAFYSFMMDYASPASIAKNVVEDKIECPIIECFDTQKRADHAKQVYGKKGMSLVIALYLNQYRNDKGGIESERLANDLTRNHKTLVRHLGKDRLEHLSLIVNLLKTFEEPKKGLLYLAAK